MSREQMCKLAMSACLQAQNAATEARRALLDAGFDVAHAMCGQLDETAGRYAMLFESFRRQLADAVADAGERTR